ncbi:eukaryotic translation initiation factor 4E type 3-B [Histomonas meleagridis]|uniref:eukaryotic translation initiation factor 4E type 3-B n=1 Tax=Histomonas meleagridis TaxID=135588 RepID=UPI003559C93C|nr:eukaryotic translation initiation factor 4E type 3-B [Histomonas meleagridis]KAH0805963.1 eukaryotic translation initiation factor 4E type 3-B [Histomonas meleagridis]
MTQHIFQDNWTFWLVIFNYAPKQQQQYQIEEIVTVNSVENFYNYYKEMPKIAEIKCANYKKASIALFKKSIKPAWEDENNADGQSICFLVSSQNVDKVWYDLMLLAVGGDLQKIVGTNNLCGIIVGPKVDDQYGVEIWTKRNIDNPEDVKANILESLEIGNLAPKIIFKSHRQ